MREFKKAADLTPTEEQILQDEEQVMEWVESLDANHLYEALIERLTERELRKLNLEESEIKHILLEIHARLQTLEQVGKDLAEIESNNSGDGAEKITPVKTPA